MSRAYVLMTALPPTNGHLHLIQFAHRLAEHVHVIVCTQPDEPFFAERVEAIETATQHMDGVHVHNIHKTLPQEPEDDPGFWDMWTGFLHDHGFQGGDYVVASEMYGQTLSEKTNGCWVPYDIDRGIYQAKATFVRENPRQNFSMVLPEFQKHLRARITFFGAESVGKTTLSRQVAESSLDACWLPEWARPYMEKFEPEVNEHVMHTIWKGQKALQLQGQDMRDKPLIIQDTDLFSTYGYWKMWESKLGPVPDDLLSDALKDKSDLYIIPRSNIPFEPDPLRFGGDVRESPDQYWVDICKEFDLRYVLLNGNSRSTRLLESTEIVSQFYTNQIAPRIRYQRQGAEYLDSTSEEE